MTIFFLNQKFEKCSKKLEIFPYTQVSLEWTYLHACPYSDSLKITKIVELVAGWQNRSKDENSGLLEEVVLSTKFVKLKIRKVQIEARDVTVLADIFGMDISACVFLQWQFENNQNRWNRRRVTKMFKRWK